MANSNKNHVHTKLSIVIGCILAISFIAIPCRADVVTGELNVGTAYDVQKTTCPVVLGTLNLYPGAEVYSWILPLGGATVNFYGGQMMGNSYIIAYSSTPNPVITVYGSNFAVDDLPLDPSATSFALPLGGYHTLTGLYGNGDLINLTFRGNISINLVTLDSGMAIDVKPGDEQNNINLKSHGVVPVAALTTEQFDAATIDPMTARFAGAAPAHWSLEDVDGDGDDDIIFHFRTQELDLTDESTEATLTAQLASQMRMMSLAQASSGGAVVSGTDKVKIIGAKNSKK
ncbi:MAG: hypothetical protein P8016_00845 [Sedimentisphaerales bacterium]|jgi:hypothetical protein